MARGGWRPGAGRPRKDGTRKADQPETVDPDTVEPGEGKAPALPPAKSDDAKAYLIKIMRAPETTDRIRLEAAKALLPFQHAKLAEQGKKDQRQTAAGKVAGKFSTAAPPKLVAAGGKKV